MTSFWWLALRNLGRNRKRNLATGSAIAFGFAGILLLAAYTHRAKNYMRVYTVYVVHTGHLAIFPREGFENYNFKPARYSLSAAEQNDIREVLEADPEVELHESQIRGQGLVGNGCVSFPFVGQGYEPEVDRKLREHSEVKEWMPNFQYILQGRNLAAFPPELGGVLLSKGLSLSLGKTRMHDDFTVQPPIGLPDCSAPREQAKKDANVQLMAGAWAGNISATDGEVVGLFTTGVQETDNSGIVTSLGVLQKLFDTDRVAEVAVWLKHPEKLLEAQARLSDQLRARGHDFEIMRWNDERLSPFYVGTVKFLETMVIAGALVLATIITLSVLNSTTMTILERSQEIGMYRSMGFRRRHLRILYVQESLWLAVFALIAGALLGVAAIKGINSAKIIYNPPGVAGGLTLTLVLPWIQALMSGLLLVLLVAFATFVAVSHRLRPSPADLLGGTLR